MYSCGKKLAMLGSPTINAFPSINPISFVSQKNKSYPLYKNRSFYLYSSGRAALHYGVLSLNLPTGSRILLPAFNCGVEVEAILKAGYSVEYYELAGNLEATILNISSKISNNTKAILIIHYFGIPQNLDTLSEFCKKNDLILIEDCAHALFSKMNRKWVGEFGDISIFSLHKTHALPNGGGLLINNSSIRPPGHGKPFENVVIIKQALRSIINFFQMRKSITGYMARVIIAFWTYFAKKIDTNKKLPINISDNDRSYYHSSIFDYTHAISKISSMLLWKESPKRTILKRQQNYELLSKILTQSPVKKIKLLFPNIDIKTCPLCLVVEIDNRDKIAAELTKLGINTFIFGKNPHPTVPLSEYPLSTRFCRKLLGLPIHQQLSKADIERVAQSFLQVINIAGA